MMFFFFPLHLQILYQEDSNTPKQNTPGSKRKVSRERAKFQKQKEDVQAIGKPEFLSLLIWPVEPVFAGLRAGHN